MITERIRTIQQEIAEACAGRRIPAGEVTLVAVTKTVPAERISEALAAGITDIGESRLQEIIPKFAELGQKLNGITRHLIGHLQTNKVKKAVELFDVIQSVDRLALAEEIDRQAEKAGKIQRCFIELKVSEESTKHGVPAGDCLEFAERLKNYSHISICGLMTMAPYFAEPEAARPYFRTAREVFDRIRAAGIHPGFTALSMGMSNDFAAAVQEGSTMVRVGTAIFGER